MIHTVPTIPRVQIYYVLFKGNNNDNCSRKQLDDCINTHYDLYDGGCV